jgi:small nuclear ribonucleoprotein (snRNP)-like protein
MSYFNGASTTNFGGNSPTGNFSPTIYSQKVLKFLRTTSVVEAVTNSDYYGELGSYGDTVNIILEPTITVNAYTRGATVTSEALADNEITLEISQANTFQFQVDDIEKKLSHVEWESLATGSATYAVKNAYDREVLTFMANGAIANHYLADNATADGTIDQVADAATAIAAPVTLGHGTGAEVDPLNLLSKLALVLDEAEVPEEGRYVIVSPRFMELLARTDSKLLSTDYNQGEGGLKNGLVMKGKLRGFSIYKTNNTPQHTGGTGDLIIAGHMSAVATVQSIDKVETIRSESTFADIVRGLHVYGRGIVRSNCLAVAAVLYA